MHTTQLSAETLYLIQACMEQYSRYTKELHVDINHTMATIYTPNGYTIIRHDFMVMMYENHTDTITIDTFEDACLQHETWMKYRYKIPHYQPTDYTDFMTPYQPQHHTLFAV